LSVESAPFCSTRDLRRMLADAKKPPAMPRGTRARPAAVHASQLVIVGPICTLCCCGQGTRRWLRGGATRGDDLLRADLRCTAIRSCVTSADPTVVVAERDVLARARARAGATAFVAHSTSGARLLVRVDGSRLRPSCWVRGGRGCRARRSGESRRRAARGSLAAACRHFLARRTNLPRRRAL
jgi:hypothetical protein